MGHDDHPDLPDDLMAQAAPCFARRETRLTCKDMVHGVLPGLGDRNCRTLAEAAGHACPYRMRHLLSRARVDEQRMLDAAAGWAAGRLSACRDGADAVLSVDQTAGEKSADSRAGAPHRYGGTAGGTALCQVAVTLTFAAPAGHALIGRALYLPGGWAAGQERRELAGVPGAIMVKAKPQLAGGLLRHAHDRGIRAGSAAGGEVYGGRDLRKSIRARGAGYVLAVRPSYAVTPPPGRRLSVKTASNLVKPAMWQRMRTGSAAKGAKDHGWAMIGILPGGTPDGQEDGGHPFPLLRRHRCTGTASYCLCWSPVPPAKLISVAVARWKTGEDHQQSKQASGLDSGQVTTWASWHRWTAICLPGGAFLAAAAAWQRARDGDTAILGLIPVTVPELLRQLRGTVIPQPRRDRAHRDGWALWRRRHQYRARQARRRWHAYADALPE
ncbi:MAG TPA: IS701 family transposase [Streptosporangiaceae bacterium]|nr:IS701 family transposase [Streptosporangiaceae bacterium]